MSEVNQDISKVIIDEWSKDEKINALIAKAKINLVSCFIIIDSLFCLLNFPLDQTRPYKMVGSVIYVLSLMKKL